jgi:hypothetical protein
MNHEMMAGPSGTFIGHLIPGLVLVALALWWISEQFFKGPSGKKDALERTLIIPIIKLVALPIAIFVEIPGSDWYPMDWVMGWHHITIYIAFALSGVVDILEKKDVMSTRATYFAFAGANLIGLIIFAGHGTGPGVEGTCHSIIVYLFFLISFFAILEGIKPNIDLKWYRIGAVLGLGLWMCISAFLIFKTGWNLHDHVKEAHVWLHFSWMLLALSTFTVGAAIVVERRWELNN